MALRRVMLGVTIVLLVLGSALAGPNAAVGLRYYFN